MIIFYPLIFDNVTEVVVAAAGGVLLLGFGVVIGFVIVRRLFGRAKRAI